MKRTMTIGLVVTLLMALAMVLAASQSTLLPALAAVPTSIPNQNAIPGDSVGRSTGGIFKGGVGIEGSEDEVQLVIVPFSAATASVMEIQNYEGTPVWSVNTDGDVTVAGDYEPSLVSVAIPTAVGTATPGLRITNLGVADSMAFLDGASVVGLIQDDGFINWEAGIDIQVPTAQATGVPGLNIKNSSVAASINVAEGESVFQELSAQAASVTTLGNQSQIITVPTAQATAVPGLDITNSSVAASINVQEGESVFQELSAQAASVTTLGNQSQIITVPTAQATAVAGLSITNSSVAASINVEEGESVFQEFGGTTLTNESQIISVPTAQATAVAGLSITNDSVAASVVVTKGESVFQEVDATFLSIAAPTAQPTASPALNITNSSVAASINVAEGESVFQEVEGTTGDFSGAVTADGGFSVDSPAFTVANTSGNTVIAGSLAANGGITADSTAFTVADTSGNVATTGTLAVTGLSTLSGGTTKLVNIENIMSPSVLKTTVSETGAGGTVVVATVGASEIWVVHDILVHTTTEWDDTAGDDEAFTIGTGEDVDGFCVLGTDELIDTYAAATGFAEGWSCNSVQDRGVFFDEAATNSFVGGFILESTETIDAVVTSGAGDDITAGSSDVYVIYTRIE